MDDHDLLTGILVGFSIVGFVGMAGCFAYIIREIRIIHGIQAAIFLRLHEHGIHLDDIRAVVKRLTEEGV